MKLHHTLVGDRQAPSSRTLWFLHGILGSGKNWRMFARRLVKELPGWKAVLVDLRHHGDSPSPPGPQTVSACADDLDALSEDLGVPHTVVGHSFGGKVALAWSARAPQGVIQAWVLDAMPGAVGSFDGDHEIVRVFQMLERIPGPFEGYDEVREAFREHGFSEMLAGWMTTNLTRRGDELVWRFDLQGARALIEDYAQTDLWPILEAPPIHIHLLVALAGDRWPPDALSRAERVAEGQGVTLHGFEDAGHWVHVDAPDHLRRVLLDSLPTVGGSPAE